MTWIYLLIGFLYVEKLLKDLYKKEEPESQYGDCK